MGAPRSANWRILSTDVDRHAVEPSDIRVVGVTGTQKHEIVLPHDAGVALIAVVVTVGLHQRHGAVEAHDALTPASRHLRLL